MRYGYRAFTLEARLNNRGESVAWTREVADHLTARLADLQGRGPIVGTPHLRAAREALAEDEPEGEEEERNPPSTWFRDVVRVSERHIHFVVSYGTYGYFHDLARRDGRAPETIEDAAAAARHRVDIFLPEDEGIRALATVEAIASRSPAKVVRLHLTAASRAAVAVPGQSGKRSGPYYGFRLYGQADGEHLRHLIASSKGAKAVFRDTIASPRGRTRRVLRSLEIGLGEQRFQEAAVRTAEAWARGLLGDADRVSDRDAIEGMKRDFNLSAEGLDALDFEIDDVALVIEGADGKPRTFTPAVMQQLFTYPVASFEPSDATYYSRVTEKVQDLSNQYGYEVAAPSAEEVVECLIDSTRAPSSPQAPDLSGTEPPSDVSRETG